MKHVGILILAILAILANVGGYASTASTILVVETSNTSKSFTRPMLLGMNIKHIHTNDSRAYLNTPMQYQAVKLCEILKSFQILPSDIIELISSDNFSALVPAKYILNCNNKVAVGYVAIENPNKPWPKLKYNNPDANHPDDGTAGPLAVIWEYPEKSYISNEYWAWKLVKIKIYHSLNEDNFLDAPKTKDINIQNGFQAYVSRCAGCHTMNKIGKGAIGPDLNIPKNPTDYFASDEQLKKFIRDPQSVRPKANDRMSGTSEQFLSNKDLSDLIAYLRYMAKQK